MIIVFLKIPTWQNTGEGGGDGVVVVVAGGKVIGAENIFFSLFRLSVLNIMDNAADIIIWSETNQVKNPPSPVQQS